MYLYEENNMAIEPEKMNGSTLMLPESTSWRNSSNVLCNYMKKSEYLDMILQNKAIIPRYNMEEIGYLGIDGLSTICFPMTCFCDIPFSAVSSHMSKYGSYGIGFDKKAVLEKNRIQPIHYMSCYSTIVEDFRTAFNQYNQTEKTPETPEVLLDYLTTTLMYMKPIWGKEPNSEGNYVDYVYQDECEWRYVPTKLPEEYSLILPQRDTTKAAMNEYSAGLRKHPESWFHFEWEDVRYIIVPDDSAVKQVIQTIKTLSLSSIDCDMLISKIEISKRFSSDR